KLNASQEVLSVLLTSSDMLADLVNMSRSGETIPPDHSQKCRKDLQSLIDGGAKPASPEDTGDIEGLSFTPVPAGDAGDSEDFAFTPVLAENTDATGDGRKIYKIAFRPKPELLRKANEPLYLLRELRSLGELELIADAGALPQLSEIQPDHPYVAW